MFEIAKKLNMHSAHRDRTTYDKIKKEVCRAITSFCVVMIFVVLAYAEAFPFILSALTEGGLIVCIVFFGKHSLDKDDKEKINNESYT